MRTPHNSTYKGKHVYVQLKDGTEFVDKFLDKNGHYCFFEARGKVHIPSDLVVDSWASSVESRLTLDFLYVPDA
jgi:hypothetical protein